MKIPVLLYHSISDTMRPGLERWTLPERLFTDHLDRLVDSGISLLTVSALVDRLRATNELDQPVAAVTFDDGWNDFPLAAQRMAERGIPSTLYVTTGYLGRPGCLRAEELRDLPDLGVEVGAHGTSHRRLDELARADVVREVTESRQVLEDLLQREVPSFAYPHGNYTSQVRACVVDAGYQSATSVKHAFSSPEDDTYAVARLLLTRDTSADDVSELLRGRGAPVAWQSERLRTRAYRTWRKLRARAPAVAWPRVWTA